MGKLVQQACTFKKKKKKDVPWNTVRRLAKWTRVKNELNYVIAQPKIMVIVQPKIMVLCYLEKEANNSAGRATDGYNGRQECKASNILKEGGLVRMPCFPGQCRRVPV